AFLAQQGFRSVLTRMKAEGLIEDGFDIESVQRMTIKTKDAPPAGADSPAGAAPKLPTGAGTYELMLDMKALEGWIARATASGTLAVATERTSPTSLTADLVGISLSVTPGAGCYIPVGHRAPGSGDEKGGLDLGGAGKAPDQLSRDKVLAALKPL